MLAILDVGTDPRDRRLRALMEPGGTTDCGNAQNCVKVCPKEVPITWAIGKVGRDTRAFSLLVRCIATVVEEAGGVAGSDAVEDRLDRSPEFGHDPQAQTAKALLDFAERVLDRIEVR